MTDYFKMRPMLLAGFICCVICIIGYYSGITVFILGIAAIFLFFVSAARRVKVKYLTVMFAAVLVCCSVMVTLSRINKLNMLDGCEMSGSFIVTEEPKERGDYYHAVIEANNCEGIRNGTRISAYGNGSVPELGDRIYASVKLKAMNDDYKLSWYSDSVYLCGSITGDISSGGNPDKVLAAVLRLRKSIRRSLFGNVGYGEASTLIALVYGDSGYITDEFYSLIKAAGVSHIMVVSGLHLTTIVTLVTLITNRFTRNRFVKALVVFLTVIFMAALCGFTKSVLRAGLCYIILALSLCFKDDPTPENSLGAAVTIMLAAEPFSVFNISFQLSVLSTLGIITVAVPVSLRIKTPATPAGRFAKRIISAIAVTLSAMLFTLPVVIYIYGYISTVSVITNLLISFAATSALTLAAVALFINAFLPFAAYPFFLAAGILTKYMNSVITFFGSMSFSTVTVGKFSFYLSIFLLCGVIILLFACKKSKDMLRLKEMDEKIIHEGGGKLKWR